MSGRDWATCGLAVTFPIWFLPAMVGVLLYALANIAWAAAEDVMRGIDRLRGRA